MEDLLNILYGVQGYIIIGLCIIIIIFIILFSVLFAALNSLEKKYRKFMRGVNNKSIEELVTGYLDKVDNAKKVCEDVKYLYEDIDIRLKNCLQKCSVIRYRAFDDVGSDLSFSVALLDDNDNGVVITGIYGRQDSTTYAKPIDKGISRYDLSEEESHALNDAMNKVIKKSK
jgi:hypothetical protein